MTTEEDRERRHAAAIAEHSHQHEEFIRAKALELACNFAIADKKAFTGEQLFGTADSMLAYIKRPRS